MNLYSHRLDGARRCAGKAPVIHQAAAELIVDRMDASAPNAGLKTWKGNRVRKADITIAKNYMAAVEIDELNRITTRFLDFAVWSQKPGSSRASGRADHSIRNTSHSACVPSAPASPSCRTLPGSDSRARSRPRCSQTCSASASPPSRTTHASPAAPPAVTTPHCAPPIAS